MGVAPQQFSLETEVLFRQGSSDNSWEQKYVESCLIFRCAQSSYDLPDTLNKRMAGIGYGQKYVPI